MASVTTRTLWHRQRDALDDLAAFIDEHAPGTGDPLPLLHWYIGPSHTVHADVHALDREHGGGHRDPGAVVAAYCDALGTALEEHPVEDAVLLVARGRIGPVDASDGLGRTHVVIRAKVPAVVRGPGGRGFLP